MKNVLFLKTGPVTVPESWFWFSLVLSASKKLRASRASFRRK